MAFHAQNPLRILEASENAIAHPYRSLANAIISLAYRNGPIENIHAGSGTAYRVTHCRFTTSQTREVIRFASERISAIISACPLWYERLPDLPPWPQRLAGLPFIMLYPEHWSLTEISSQIRLEKEWIE
jgi:hypothetical protein